MKENELRVGNYVLDSSDWLCHADSITIAMAQNYKPIKISEEWLLTAGFVKDERLGRLYYDIPVRNTFLTVDYATGSWKYSIGNNGDIYQVIEDDYWTEIKYVHQLQNLYYALTERELLFPPFNKLSYEKKRLDL